MSIHKHLSGTGVALVTPFKKNGEIDFPSLEKLVKHVTKGGVDYLVVLGTTGESVTLNKEEKKNVFDFICSANKNKLPVVLGIGGNNTKEIIEQFAFYDMKKAAAVLSVSPYYNKPSQKGIIEHFKAIAKASPVPVILYNVPGRTGSNMSAETTLTLAAVKNIIGIKEASGSIEQCMSIISRKPKDFLIISGDDGITLPMIAAGAVGVISVLANSHPKDFSEMVRYALKHDLENAKRIHYKYFDAIPLLFAEGNPGGIKEVLSNLGVCQNHVRMPLVTVSKELAKKLKKAFN
jgi:4-hydroxy-tetrahydrodipicolinate synthase